MTLRPGIAFALVAALAACADEPSATSAAAVPTDAAAPAADTAAPAASAGTATVTFRGPGVDVSGEYLARYCGDPAFLPPAPAQGVMYEVTFEGHTLNVSDTEARRAGEHALVGGGWNVLLNGPSGSYLPNREAGGRLVVSDDFKTAALQGAMEIAASADATTFPVEVTFRCR